MSREVVVVSAVRTAIGTFGGSLKDSPPTDLGALVVREALARGETGLHAALRERFDQVLLETALEHTDGHRQLAAEKLGLGRNTVTRKLGATRRRKSP